MFSQIGQYLGHNDLNSEAKLLHILQLCIMIMFVYPVFHSKNNLVKVDVYFGGAKESFSHVSSTHELDHSLTKPPSTSHFQILRSKLEAINDTPILWEAC